MPSLPRKVRIPVKRKPSAPAWPMQQHFSVETVQRRPRSRFRRGRRLRMPVSQPASVFQIRRRRPPPTKESLGLIIAELLPEVVQVRRSAPAGPRTANRLNRLLAPPGFDRILRSKRRGLHHPFSAAPGPRAREMRVFAVNCGETLVASWRRVGGGFHPKGGSVRFGFARTAPSLAG